MFKIASRAVGDAEPLAHLAGADGLVCGMAATMTAGALAKASGRPTHIIMGRMDSAGRYPAVRVLPTTVFETASAATVADTLIGSAVALSPDALGVTAATGSGVFTITDTDGAAGSSTVRGYFA